MPRKDYHIVDLNNNNIGYVTSGTMSPSLKKGIGMGYIMQHQSSVGNIIFIKIRDKKIKAQIVKRPFYDNK